jgi:hypothetical protein
MQASVSLNPWIRTPFFDYSFIVGAFLPYSLRSKFSVSNNGTDFLWCWVIFLKEVIFGQPTVKLMIYKYRKENSLVIHTSLVFFLFPVL